MNTNKYIIISTKTPREMEEILNSKYKIEALGNTWVTNGTIYQSFLGEKLSAKQVPKIEPKETLVTPKVTKKPVKRKKPKEKKDV